jgi:hypothetical protein
MASWSIRSGEQDILIAPRAAEAPAGASPFAPRDACFRVLDWASPSALPHSALAAMVQAVEPHVQRIADMPLSWLRSRLADALRDGRLVAYAVEPAAIGFTVAEDKGTAQTNDLPPPPKEVKTWVAIKLVDEKGDPVPFKSYSIDLPDGSTRQGVLDDKGMARIGDIDPGTCQVSFPQYDASDWQAA